MFGYNPDREKRIKQVGAAVVASAVIGAYAANNAANTAADAQQNAINQQNQALASQKALEQPFVNAGTQALSTMQAGLKPGGQYNTPFTAANFQNTPAYQFQMQQGQQGIKNAGAATGRTGSGAQEQALATFNQGLASTTYQQQYNNYMNNQQQQFNNMAGIESQGQAAASGQAAQIGNTANNVSNLTVAQGQIQASGQLGIAQAFGQGLNSYTQNQYAQQLQNQQAQQQLSTLQSAFNPNGGAGVDVSNLNVPGVNSGL